MQQAKKSRIKIPLYIKIAAPFAFYFIIFIAFLSFSSIKDAITRTKERISEIVEMEIKNKISFAMLEAGIVHKDMRFLANAAETRHYLDALNFDDKMQEFKELEEGLFYFGQTRQKDYSQIRVLNSRGVEILKVKNSENETILADGKDLGNESDKYYVKEALALEPNQIYISPLDLETTDSMVEYPINPIFRVAVKSFDKNQKNFVILMLDFKANTILKEAKTAGAKEEQIKEEHKGMLVNQDGYYLAHEDANKEWGMLLENESANIKNDNPWLANIILSQEKGHLTNPKTGDLIYFESIEIKDILGFASDARNYEIISPQEKIIFAEITNSSAVFNIVKPLRNSIFLEGGVIFIIGVILIFIVSTLITRPLKKLAVASGKLAKGEWNIDVNIKTSDEIETLADSFNNMASSLKDLHKNLEDKVEERTLELNQEKDRLRKIIDTLPVGVMIASSPMGKIILANSKGFELLGKYEKAPTIEQYVKMYNLTKPDGTPYPDSELPFYVSLRQGRASVKDDIIVKREKGGDIQLLVSAVPIFNNKGTITDGVMVFEDITKLKDVDRLKTEFISIASHQLKTPIGSLEWLAEMLLANDAGKLNAKQRTMVSEMYATSQRISQLVNDLLNVSRLEMGKIVPESSEFGIASLIKEVKQELSAQYSSKKQKIKIELEKELPKIKTDYKILREILENLLSNAIKYTPDMGSIYVSVHKDKKNFLFTVKDNGIGIPQDEQNRIFNKFFRAENAKETHIEGTGLGLYVVKSMAEVLGGKIWFESEENKGTTISFTIPIK